MHGADLELIARDWPGDGHSDLRKDLFRNLENLAKFEKMRRMSNLGFSFSSSAIALHFKNLAKSRKNVRLLGPRFRRF